MAEATQSPNDSAAHEESHDLSGYFVFYFVILGLFALSFVLSFTDLGIWNVVLALAIATVQAVCLSSVFMHLKESDKLTWLIVLGSLFWTFILFLFVLTDYVTRHLGVI